MTDQDGPVCDAAETEMTPCALVRAWLPAWFLGDEDAHDAAIREHCESCPECRSAREGLHPSHCAVPRTWLFDSLRSDTDALLARDIESHLMRCPACRGEARLVRAADRECYRHLAPYRLSRTFIRAALRDWTPPREHRIELARHGGFAAHIERAASGNRYAQERLVEEFGPYAYLRTYLLTGDFHWASEVTAAICRAGIPMACSELDRAGFLAWLDAACREETRVHPWYGEGHVAPAVGDGLPSGGQSVKLRRHRLILNAVREASAAAGLAFLDTYVQNARLARTAALLGQPEAALRQARLALFTTIRAALEQDGLGSGAM